MRRLAGIVTSLLILTATSCGSNKDLGEQNVTCESKTIIYGTAPLNAGGYIVVTSKEAGDYYENKTFKGSINDDGTFSVEAEAAFGRVLVEASGGHYVEPASGRLAMHAGETLRAAIPQTELCKRNEVHVTPWTHLAFAHGGFAGYGDSAKALTDMLTCQQPAHVGLLTAAVARPTKRTPIQSLSTEALGYIHLGALSQLAHDLSSQYHVQSGARLNSMQLTQLLAEDFADGRIDGRNKTQSIIYAFADHALPPDVLRQKFAQAARRFLSTPASPSQDWGNLSNLGETAVLDILRCLSENTDPRFGPPGELLDVTGPTLSIVTPAPGSYLASTQDVVCEGHDPSGVASLEAVFLGADGKTQVEARDDSARVVGDGTSRRFVAPLRVEALTTGPVRVRCDATDKWGNANSLIENFHINRGGVAPEMTISEERAGLLQGRVEITCDCERDPYSIRCVLEGARGPFDVIEQGARKTKYAWDTRNVLDGPHELTCTNTTSGLPRPLVASKAVRVKNHENGSAQGAVYLDTPVRGMQVTAFAYEDGAVGKRLGGADVEDNGKFDFELSTEYRGPIFLRADYSRSPNKMASFHNVPLDKGMSCSNAVLTLLIEHYEPGETLPGLSLNVASTMHEALAVALYRTGSEPTFVGDGEQQGAVRTAYTLVSNYLSGGDGDFDPRRTPVADLSHAERDSAHDQDVLGLLHVGLSRLAADISIQRCGGNPERITIANVIEAMKLDLEDGQLDGKRHGEQVLLGCGVPLAPDFFRIDLARAIRRWLDRTPYVGYDIEPVNKSGLNAAALKIARSPVLQNLAKHHSVLFGGRPGEEYDGDGPTIRWRAYGADHNDIGLANATVGATSIMFVVDASDDTGIAHMEVTLNKQVQDNQASGGDAGHGQYLIRTAQLEGPQLLVVHAVDGKGNSRTEQIGFAVDHVEPKAVFAVSELWINDGASYHLAATLSKANVTAQVYLDDAAVGKPVQVEGKTIAVSVPLECGATHRVGIEMRDIAGNISRKHQVVHCDDKPPTIGQLPSQHIQVQNGNVVSLALHLQEDPDNFLLAEGEKDDLLQVRWDRLDDREGNAQPTLNFSVGDVEGGSIGSPPNTLRVSYRYIFRGKSVSRERGWTPIKCSREGVCKLSLSYQAMLPDEILREPVSVARRNNFVAFSQPNDVHSVIVKVEDLAGNATFAEWSFRMKLYAPPVTVTCAWSVQAAGKSLIPNTVAELQKREQVLTKVSADSGLTLDESTLTPAGSHRVELQDSMVEWRVRRVMTKRLNTGVGVPICDEDKKRNAGLARCMNDGGHYYFDDGECLKEFTPSPQSGFDRDVNYTARQTIRPVQPYIELTSATPAGERESLTSSELLPNGGPAWLLESGQWDQGRTVVVRKRSGWRMLAKHNRCHRMEEIDHAHDLTISRVGAYLPHVSTVGDTPEPLAIVYQGCNSGEIVWSDARGTVGAAIVK